MAASNPGDRKMPQGATQNERLLWAEGTGNKEVRLGKKWVSYCGVTFL